MPLFLEDSDHFFIFLLSCFCLYTIFRFCATSERKSSTVPYLRSLSSSSNTQALTNHRNFILDIKAIKTLSYLQYTNHASFIEQYINPPATRSQSPPSTLIALLLIKMTSHSFFPTISSSTSETSSTISLVPTSTTYLRSGLGGAGNYHKTTSSNTQFITVTAQRPSIHRSSRSFYTGIGGFGNAASCEGATIPPREELARKQMLRDNAPISWHYGIGGAGNRANRIGEMTAGSLSLADESFVARRIVGGADKLREAIGVQFRRRAA